MKISLQSWLMLLGTAAIVTGCGTSQNDEAEKMADLFCRFAEVQLQTAFTSTPELREKKRSIESEIKQMEVELEKKYSNEEVREISKAAEEITEECLNDLMKTD